MPERYAQGYATLVTQHEQQHQQDDNEQATGAPEVWGGGCECWVTPAHTWFRYGGAIEPGSAIEYNPECPMHGEAADD